VNRHLLAFAAIVSLAVRLRGVPPCEVRLGAEDGSGIPPGAEPEQPWPVLCERELRSVR
jgi:hypothetical protein